MSSVLDKQVKIKTDKWSGYNPLKKNFVTLVQVESDNKGGDFPELRRTIRNFKGWLIGIHHQVKHLQPYIYEYYYRFNRNYIKVGIFENLLLRMVIYLPVTYKRLIY